MNKDNKIKNRRAKRVRQTIKSSSLPRLSIYRSNKYIFAQIIDDSQGKTLASLSSKKVDLKGNKTAQAKEVGKKLATLAKESKITKVVFDRGRYRFHGRVKALAEGAKEGGLQF